jgi:HNH endonuclease
MLFSMQRHRVDKISRQVILRELAKFAAKNGYVAFGHRDFDARDSENCTIHSSTVKREFDGWGNAINTLKSFLAEQGVSLKPRNTGYYNSSILSAEMKRIWVLVGHRPSQQEWQASSPIISCSTYKRYYGGWEPACLAFVEGTMSTFDQGKKIISHSSAVRNPRDVSPKMRLQVFLRDQYRCAFCGRGSPEHVLHADHKKPWSKGGKTIIENLQTLCATCNAAKGNSENFERV